MAYGQYHGVALQQRADGALILAHLTTVTVKMAGTNTLATLFADVDGNTPLVNPFPVDTVYATLDFYASTGRYHIILTKVGWTFPDDLLNILVGGDTLLHLMTPVVFVDGAAVAIAQDALPAGVRIFDVTLTNTVAPGASHGLTSYNVGDGVLVDRWGHGIPLTQGHVTSAADYTTDELPIYSTGGDIVLSGNGGVFDSVGAVMVDVAYQG